MTDVPALLDQLHDWIVAYDRAGKTYADFDHELAAAHPELIAMVEADKLDDHPLEAYGLIMSLADARGLLLPPDTDPDTLILPPGNSTPP